MKPANVLVVDDNEDIVETFSMILGMNGYKVETANNGLSAVDKSNIHHFDVILMDINMPRMDGVEALRRIKARDQTAKVIIMTAYYEGEGLRRVLNEGAFSAVSKPADVGRVMRLIDRATADLSVMIVDDDASIGETLSRVLQLEGYRTYAVCSGEEAVQMLAAKTVQVALIDIKLPAMNGVETAVRLKALNPNIANVLMTAYRDEVQELIAGAGAVTAPVYLYKPFAPSEVVEIIGQIAA